ncbi:hypothetical protein [Planomonospora sp. ID82291]|uniref:hypothetical protein n=1 Tax=Planomonospora sp. ID82291 TaxID=2738136 RepID=UPI0018C3F7FC|nr:hypothetical protein [Planomonospora sp. ID82291]MBG0818438.1 hypothetical protein [Planomonospora sp. ID82291]
MSHSGDSGVADTHNCICGRASSLDGQDAHPEPARQERPTLDAGPTGGASARTLEAEAVETWARIAPLIAGRLRVRVSPDGGHSFPDGLHSRPLAPYHPQLPNRPATVSIYGDDGQGRVLVADLDVGRALTGGATPAEAAAQVAAEADALVELVERCGGRAITDLSPSGGRHVYIRWSRRLPWQELRRVTRALARRFPTIDVKPMSGPAGQIRPPGAMHKIKDGRPTGYMRLTVPVEEAEQILKRPCGAKVWAALQQELTAELAAVEAVSPGAAADGPALAEAGRTCPACGTVVDVALDADGYPWLPRPSGRRPLPSRMQRLAGDGDWQALGYASASEARLGLLNSIAAAGVRFDEVIAGIRSGAWAGLEVLLDSRTTRPRSLHERKRRLRWDWHKSVTDIAAHRHARRCNTSPNHPSTAPRTLPSPAAPGGPGVTRDRSLFKGGVRSPVLYKVDSGGLPVGGGDNPLLAVAQVHDQNLWGVATVDPQIADERVLDCWQEILQWRTCVWLAERDPERVAGWGRAAASIRLLLRAMAVAARMDGSTQPAFGVRSLSEMCGLDYTVVARHLQRLRDEEDALVERVEAGRGKLADRYRLRVPAEYRAQARWIRWRGGRIDVLHPALHMLGPVVALVYEALCSEPTGSTEVARAALVSRSATSEALRVLAAYQLAERAPDGWVRGRRGLDAAAAELGGDVAAAERRALYREHRRIWHRLVDSWERDPVERDHADWNPDIPWPTAPSPESVDEAFDGVDMLGRGPAEAEVPWPTEPWDRPDEGVARSPRRLRAWPESVPRRRRYRPDAVEQLELFSAARAGAA